MDAKVFQIYSLKANFELIFGAENQLFENCFKIEIQNFYYEVQVVYLPNVSTRKNHRVGRHFTERFCV